MTADQNQRDELAYKSHLLTWQLRDLAGFLSSHCDVGKTTVFQSIKPQIATKDTPIHVTKSELGEIIKTAYDVVEKCLKNKNIDKIVFQQLVMRVVAIYHEISLDFDESMYYRSIVTNFIVQHLNIRTDNQRWFSDRYSGHYVLVSCNLSGEYTTANFIIKPPARPEYLPEYETKRMLDNGLSRTVYGVVYQDGDDIFALGNITGGGKLRFSTLLPFKDDLAGLRHGISLLENAPGSFPIYCRRVPEPLKMENTGVCTEEDVVTRLRSIGDPEPDLVIRKLPELLRLGDEMEALWRKYASTLPLPDRPARAPWSFGVKLKLPR